jgi:hypothetical protein
MLSLELRYLIKEPHHTIYFSAGLQFIHILCVLTTQGKAQVATPQKHLKSPSPMQSPSPLYIATFILFFGLGVNCL